MKFLGNFKNWITAELLETLLINDGDLTPVYQPEKWRNNPDFDEARIAVEKAGYPSGNHHFCQYTKETECLKNLDIQMPIPLERKDHHWWFIKLNPGQMQPMHFDPHVKLTKNCIRYTMPLLDYQPGHVFVEDNFLLTDYKAGDLFEWDRPDSYHGVVNISMNPRITLQLSVYDSD